MSHDGKAVDGIRINAMISNAVSSAKTLMEALAVFDQTYISEEQQFKKQYISAAYDEYFLLIHAIYLEFWNYASWSLENLYSKVLERLELHPEYIDLVDGYPFVAVYDDEQNLKHGFLANADFLRTFPEVKRTGIEIDVNNVAGGGPFDEMIRHAYRAFVWLDQLLKSDGVTVAKEVLDWCSRMHAVYQMMQSFSKSFGKKKEEKLDLRYLKRYLRRNDQWDLKALSRSLNCEEDLLRILLVGLGYRSADEKIYFYDAEQAKKIMTVYERCQEEDQQSTQRLTTAFGTSIQSLKDEVECMNAGLYEF